MKQFISCLCALALIFAPLPPPVFAQSLNTIGGALTASASACSAGVVLPLRATDSTGTIQLSGTFVGTASFFVSSSGGAAYTAINGTPSTGAASASTATAAGLWTFDVAGKTNLCVYASSYTSGTFNVSITSGTAPANTTSVPVPQNLSSASTPTFAGVNQTTGGQFNGVPSKVFVASAFTTDGVSVGLNPITGLSWLLPASTALNVGFHCAGTYYQNNGAAAVSFGLSVTAAPTTSSIYGIIGTNTTAFTQGATTITTATSATVMSATPNAAGVVNIWMMDGFVENPSTTANTMAINVKTATAADTVVVQRDSYCALQF